MGIGQARVPKHGTPRLYGLDDLVGEVARQRKAGRVTVYFHGPAQGLLGSVGHAERGSMRVRQVWPVDGMVYQTLADMSPNSYCQTCLPHPR